MKWGFGVSNILIVESKNDQLFFEALVNHLNLTNIEIGIPICQIDDYECLEGLDKKKLTGHLHRIKNESIKRDIQAIGIVLDHDGKREERLKMINLAIKEVFNTDEQFTDTSQFITILIDGFELKIACFLTHVDGKGELETVLKAIKTKESPYADCLKAWKECLKEYSKDISDKDFDKFWLNNYIRFDTCSSEERRQANRKCSLSEFEYVMKNKKDVFNFEDTVLDDVKNFLKLFN